MNSSSKAHTGSFHDCNADRNIETAQEADERSNIFISYSKSDQDQYDTIRQTTSNTQLPSTNYLIYTDAGKLLFFRYGDEAGLATISGLFQTLSAVINDENLGEVHCINTVTSNIVFMSVGAITLVAIAYKDCDGQCDTVDNLRLQLECLYSGIIFTMTDVIQYMVLRNDPQFDLIFLLGSANQTLKCIMNDMNCFESQSSRKSCCWIGGGGGVDIISPIPTEVSTVFD
jgi:Trafficking protein Mon1.